MTETDTQARPNRITLLDRSEAGKLALTGEDAKPFLDGQVSNAVLELEPGSGMEATLLTPKGKMLALVRLLDRGDELLLTTDRVSLQALFDRLRLGLIGWQVELHKRTVQMGMLSLAGPGARELAGAPETLHAHAEGPFGLAVATVQGADVLCPAEATEEVRARLLDAGAEPGGEDEWEIARVERGDPRYGVDVDDSVIPQEAGLNDRTVSFTKACYVGQETVARLHWRGRPNRHLRGLRLAAPAEPGAPVWLGEKQVGTLTSAVVSPAFGPIGLGLLRREAEPGTQVRVGGEGAGDGSEATVCALPFA